MSISLDLVLLLLYFMFCRKLVEISKKMNLAPPCRNRAHFTRTVHICVRTVQTCTDRANHFWKQIQFGQSLLSVGRSFLGIQRREKRGDSRDIRQERRRLGFPSSGRPILGGSEPIFGVSKRRARSMHRNSEGDKL